MSLQPGAPQSQITCSLEQALLDDNPIYEALSYTWGDAKEQTMILCNGSLLPVTRNLEEALQRLRYEDRTRRLWVDAICVNQQDNIERGYQVSIMRDIYSTADCVIVWLGPERDDSRKAIDFMVKLCEVLCTSVESTAYELTHDYEEFFERTGDACAHTLLKGYLQSLEATSLAAVDRFFHRSWFGRIWVIQEVTRDSRVIALCGDETVAFEVLVLAVNILSAAQVQGFVQYPFHDSSLPRIDLMRSKMNLEGYSFPRLFFYTRCFSATDSRDMIYALLGCSGDKHIQNIVPDYGLAVSKVHLAFASNLFNQLYGLDALSYVRHTLNDGGVPAGSPSWLPAYADRTGSDSLSILMRGNAAASFDLKANYSLQYSR